MFSFTESISIEASPDAVWQTMIDLNWWWPPSNPEHESVERLDPGLGLEVGTRLRIREKIAGIPGEALGEIAELQPGARVTWESPSAVYRWHGIPVTMGEGVTWTLDPMGPGATRRLSAHVWASFPAGTRGKLLEVVFTRLLGGVAKDRAHTRTELRFLKKAIEESAG